MLAVLAALPSPPDNDIHIGPLTLRAYGLMIALGAVAAVMFAQRRWQRQGGTAEDITAIATWAIPAGLVGARLYHVLTDLQKFEGRWLDALAIWKGGLGIPGGLIAGVATGVWVARRRGLQMSQMMDVVAPAIPLAQAIGRLGNWFNQELFGRPTDLPWGLRIDPENRPARFLDEAQFHPTFLYEGLWNLALIAVLLLVERTWRLRPGQLFLLYVGGYGVGRLWVEALRADEATQILGLRVNIWMSLVAIVGASVLFIIRRKTPVPLAAEEPTPV